MPHTPALLMRTAFVDVTTVVSRQEGTELRTGVASVALQDNLLDGGAAVGILSYNTLLTQCRVGGMGPDEPDATWEFSLQRCTYENSAAFYIVAALSLQLAPPLPDKQLRLRAHVADLNMRDCVTISPTGSPFDGLYYIITGTETLVERSRFERNGIFSETSGSGPSIWPFPGGETATTYQHVASEWRENAAGRGPATYVLPGNLVLLYRQCLFRYVSSCIYGLVFA